MAFVSEKALQFVGDCLFAFVRVVQVLPKRIDALCEWIRLDVERYSIYVSGTNRKQRLPEGCGDVFRRVCCKDLSLLDQRYTVAKRGLVHVSGGYQDGHTILPQAIQHRPEFFS